MMWGLASLKTKGQVETQAEANAASLRQISPRNLTFALRIIQ